jgi:Holliday junction resolvasome RuvABC endonuclease subunit
VLLSISTQFKAVLTAGKPDEAHFELPGKWMHRCLSRNAVEVMGTARGVMLLGSAETRIPMFETDFHTICHEMLGGWKAGKTATATYLSALGISLPKRPLGSIDSDIADAMRVALHVSRVKKVRQFAG